MGRQAGKRALLWQILGKSLKPKVESKSEAVLSTFGFYLSPYSFQPARTLMISKQLKINHL
ncbi:hypothetical protein A4D02_15135 [Niastella koreensis]|uniref:Uncharacterized protein n=1 Tax=Niastella koreensis TaxID=354356 RepID=A0ABX3NNC6_9BACT|nr:hypothetical protein A4D02_15135 [Niastella koreensis]